MPQLVIDIWIDKKHIVKKEIKVKDEEQAVRILKEGISFGGDNDGN